MALFSVNTDCEFAASPCSNYALFYTFYGIAVAISGHNVGYVSIVYAVLLVLSLFSTFGLSTLDTTIHFSFGLISGIVISLMLKTVLIAPANVMKHKYQMVLYLVELAVAALIFVSVDDIVPENGFPRGLWTALLWYVLWFGAVYFINFKYGAFENKTPDDIVWFTRTYSYWGFAMFPYFVLASLTFLNRYITGLLATMVNVSIVLLYRLLAQRRRGQYYN